MKLGATHLFATTAASVALWLNDWTGWHYVVRFCSGLEIGAFDINVQTMIVWFDL